MPEGSQAEDIHEGVALISRIKNQFPAHRGNPHAVAIMGDPRHHPMNQGARSFARFPGGIRAAKPQGIHKSHRTGSHREDVAQDSSHPGGRTLERLHRAGVIVGFNFESQGQPVAGIHHAGILLPRLHQHGRSGGGKFLQLTAGVFVGAVLAPHHREHAQFRFVGFPAQPFLNPVKLLRGQPKFQGKIPRLHEDLPAPAAPRRIPRPSIPPISGSQQRSGCGIMPSTLPSRLRMPAMFRLEPFGLASAVTRPCSSQ